MKRILLADDHVDIRRLVRLSLGYQYELIEASNGAEALEKALQERPDLIILDVMMPGQPDGLGVLDAVRADPGLCRTPVFMVTARGQDHDREDALRRGATEYIIKPFSPLQLKASIKARLEG